MSVWAGRGMYTRIKLVGSRITTNAPVRQRSRNGACPRSRRCRHWSHMSRSRRCDRCSSSMATRCSHQHNTTRDAGNKWTCLSPSTAKLGSESYTQQRFKHGRTLRILKLLKHSSAQFNIISTKLNTNMRIHRTPMCCPLCAKAPPMCLRTQKTLCSDLSAHRYRNSETR